MLVFFLFLGFSSRMASRLVVVLVGGAPFFKAFFCASRYPRSLGVLGSCAAVVLPGMVVRARRKAIVVVFCVSQSVLVFCLFRVRFRFGAQALSFFMLVLPLAQCAFVRHARHTEAIPVTGRGIYVHQLRNSFSVCIPT